MVLLDGFLSLNEYLDAFEEGRIPKPSRCPNCGRDVVWFIGCYERYVNLLLDGEVRLRQKIQIRRCRCASCGKSFGLLPGFLYPRRQYGLESTEGAVSKLLADPKASPGGFKGDDGLGPSYRTVRRWVSWLSTLKGAAPRRGEEGRATAPARRPGRLRFSGTLAKLAALGGEGLVLAVERVLQRIRAWHRGWSSGSRSRDPRALRSYLRWRWRTGGGLLFLLTKGPWAPHAFYPTDAS